MNDNTLNSKKIKNQLKNIKIINHLKRILNQSCAIFFLVYLSELFIMGQPNIDTDFDFMLYFLFYYIEFLLVARYYDWTYWKEFERILLFLKLAILTLILILLLKLVFFLIRVIFTI